MTLDTLLILSGAFVAALPFLGFPSSWDKVILLIVGIFVLSLGVALRRRGYAKAPEHKESDIFVGLPASRGQAGEPQSEHDTH